VSLRSTIGHAARLTVEESERSGPRLLIGPFEPPAVGCSGMAKRKALTPELKQEVCARIAEGDARERVKGPRPRQSPGESLRHVSADGQRIERSLGS
jgi:hypothetical protein